jgi:hypothetical protein
MSHTEETIAELKKVVKIGLNESNWKTLKRVHALVKCIAEKERLSIQDQLTVRSNVFEDDDNKYNYILSDAYQLDKLGAIGIEHAIKNSSNLNLIVSNLTFYTETAKSIATSRLQIIKDFLILKDMESRGADFNPQCDRCFIRSNEIGFLPCHHAFCSDCLIDSHGGIQCTICNEYHSNERDVLWKEKVIF